MSVMQKFRRSMPAVIVILIIMFVLLIVFEWGDASRGSGKARVGGEVIGEVNGYKIGAIEFQEQVDQMVESQRQGNPDADVNTDQISDVVWQRMVDEALIESTADELGIVVSDEMISEYLLYTPPDYLKKWFTDTATGTYHEDQYFQFMRNPRGWLKKNNPDYPAAEVDKLEKELIKVADNIRTEKLRDLVQSVIAAGTVPSPGEALMAYQDQRSKANGSLALIEPQGIVDSTIAVSDADAQAYYEAHKAEFAQKPTRELKYVTFQMTPGNSDSVYTNKRLREVSENLSRAITPAQKDSVFRYFASRFGSGSYDGSRIVSMKDLSSTPELLVALTNTSTGTVIGPIQLPTGNTMVLVAGITDSAETMVKAQHILLRSGGDDDSIRTQAEGIAKRARSGESFEQLAQTYSADGSASNGGDLGYFDHAQMVKPFADAAFGASPGSIVGPVKTEYGYHIIKVNDRTNRGYRLIDMRFDIKVSNTTRNAIRQKARSFREKLIANGGTIDSLAKAENLQVTESGPISRAQPVAGSPSLNQWAYTAKQNDVSDVIQLDGGNLIVAQLVKVKEQGTMTFEDAKDQIVVLIRQKRKLDMIKDKAEKLRAALQPGDSLGKLSAIDSTVKVYPFRDVTRTGALPAVGYEPAVTSAIFELKLNEISPLIRGIDRGYYVVVVDSRSIPDEAAFATEQEKFIQTLVQQRRSEIYNEWLGKMRNESDIIDHRTR